MDNKILVEGKEFTISRNGDAFVVGREIAVGGNIARNSIEFTIGVPNVSDEDAIMQVKPLLDEWEQAKANGQT